MFESFPSIGGDSFRPMGGDSFPGLIAAERTVTVEDSLGAPDGSSTAAD